MCKIKFIFKYLFVVGKDNCLRYGYDLCYVLDYRLMKIVDKVLRWWIL